MPAPVLRVVLGLVIVAAALGLWAGYRFATLSETEVIEAAAAHYVDTGGAREDCIAQPGTPPVWVTVICRAPDGVAVIYQADRFGRLTRVDPADPNRALKI